MKIIRMLEGLEHTEDDIVAIGASFNHFWMAKLIMNQSARGVKSDRFDVVRS